jgi:hypothetical protein
MDETAFDVALTHENEAAQLVLLEAGAFLVFISFPYSLSWSLKVCECLDIVSSFL